MKTLKNLSFLILIIILASCANTPPRDYALLTVHADSYPSDSLRVQVLGSKSQIITRNERGIFMDTIRFNKDNGGLLAIIGEKDFTFVYLKNDKEVDVKFTKDDFSTMTFSNDLTKENDLLKNAYVDALSYKDKLKDVKTIDIAETSKKEYTENFSERAKEISQDSIYISSISKVTKNFARVNITGPVVNKVREYRLTEGDLSKGKPAPKFVDFENLKGGKTSLGDLKGKYVYIDIWATWCIYCKQEIPYLKTIEKKYHGKNIEFVSISYDSKKDHQKWVDMIKDKKLGGVQLFANMDKSFTKAFGVRGYPTFLLVDPKGNIVTADAPRPSDPELVKLFDSLL
ncbi:TlpA family protein disulfide reductase [Halosquirtibacter xylanolyticus]|uniref:TlpA family protein disulfide reductase n=1 Tax=Halosquirtibacter xylanolyticus TaxID=3374599 RepID=UPI003747D85C|nr:TlpA family protein disulfide reductase [Prolixibacteraceae bacterium]